MRRQVSHLTALLSIVSIHITFSFAPPLPSFQTQSRSSTELMGIRGFREWFQSQFPDAIQEVPKNSAAAHDTFDHVLVDMNQILHQVVRKSRTDGHALAMLMKELDAVVQLATPTQSLVLAMDGPPSAAKLATQRKRRYSTVTKAEWKLKNLDKLGSRIKPKVLARKKRIAAAESRTLCITPGTDFMKRAEQAILYWAWQRLDARTGVLSKDRVKIFLSPSTVPGEGEVKLLEWIYSKRRRGESIAILGGDSDLVLEALVIPIASTHNVFVLWPDGSTRYLSVSLWETTRSLARLFDHMEPGEIMRIRTDLTLLLILNGNDYLPKLRGSGGFRKLFLTYLKLQQEWHSMGKKGFLVDPDSLEFDLPFCIQFFRRIAAGSSLQSWKADTKSNSGGEEWSSSLQTLNNFVDAGYLPSPVEFQVVSDEETRELVSNDDDKIDVEEEDGEWNEPDDLEGDEEEDQVLVRLLLGKPDTDDFHCFEIWHPRDAPLKKAKHKLSTIALKELTELESDEEEPEEDGLGITSSGFEWEIKHAVKAKVDTYLYGLLWNLQTYQDGICADYAYNYGKRLSPSASEIATFLEKAQQQDNAVGPRDLAGAKFFPSLSAGQACLAALPSRVKHMVPEPYCLLPDDTVESIYGNCMSPEDNVFDAPKFARLCEEAIKQLDYSLPEVDTVKPDGPHERRMYLSDHTWTALSKVPKPLVHPFDPPPPFSERFSKLRYNKQLRLSRVVAINAPRPRSVWGDTIVETSEDDMGLVVRSNYEIKHSEPPVFITSIESLDEVNYKVAFRRLAQKEKAKKRKVNLTVKKKMTITPVEPVKNRVVQARSMTSDTSIVLATPPPKDSVTTKDGISAMSCLKQLYDAGLIGDTEWIFLRPSPTPSASANPSAHECVRLTVKSSKTKSAVLHEDLVFEKDRHVHSVSRQAVKQYVASLALFYITGPTAKWSEKTYKELKSFLLDKAAA